MGAAAVVLVTLLLFVVMGLHSTNIYNELLMQGGKYKKYAPSVFVFYLVLWGILANTYHFDPVLFYILSIAIIGVLSIFLVIDDKKKK